MKNIKILGIDNDASSRNYLSKKLRSECYSLKLAASGKEGLIKARKGPPDYIIVDPKLSDISGADLITRLRQDRRTSLIKIIALAEKREQVVEDSLLRGGYNEYLVKSSQAMQRLIAIISENDLQFNDNKVGKLIVFLSAKGGTGTSSLCANIAVNVGNKSKDFRVVFVDLVLPVGSIANIVGYNDKTNLINLIDETRENINPEILKDRIPKLANWIFSLLSGSPDPESAKQLDVGRIHLLLSVLRDTYDYIFIDLGTSLSQISLPIILQATVVALVMSNDLSTITLTKTVWKYLQNQGVDPKHVYPLLNRAGGLQGLTKAEVDKMLGFQIRMSIPNMREKFYSGEYSPRTSTYKIPHRLFGSCDGTYIQAGS